MKIAVFGGAFDPIHLGHIRLARESARRLDLDRIMLIPSSVPPHKLRRDMAAANDRLEMCRIAAGNDPLFMVSDIEIKRGGASFTADTFEELGRLYPDAELYLITGADMFLTLGTWNRFEEIAKRAVLCSVPRDGVGGDRLREYAAVLEKRGARCIILDITETAVSSTEIRRRILAGESLDGLVPPGVEEYINSRGLYRVNGDSSGNGKSVGFAESNKAFIEMIRGRLTPQRFCHSMAVAEQAARLAELYGADPQKAYTAGVLHDIMKDVGAKAQLQILDDFGIILGNAEKALPGCWHAISGAVFIEQILGVNDRDIINAVRYHTTARAGMSLLEETIYLADFTSSDRDYPDVDEMRRLAESDRREAMLYALSYTIRDLVDRGSVIHPDAIHAYNERIADKSKTDIPV